MYPKYVIAMPVNAISEYRIVGFCSTPLKYPFFRMLVNTVLCKNNALPTLLNLNHEPENGIFFVRLAYLYLPCWSSYELKS
jgi:hypothetical protein